MKHGIFIVIVVLALRNCTAFSEGRRRHVMQLRRWCQKRQFKLKISLNYKCSAVISKTSEYFIAAIWVLLPHNLYFEGSRGAASYQTDRIKFRVVGTRVHFSDQDSAVADRTK